MGFWIYSLGRSFKWLYDEFRLHSFCSILYLGGSISHAARIYHVLLSTRELLVMISVVTLSISNNNNLWGIYRSRRYLSSDVEIRSEASPVRDRVTPILYSMYKKLVVAGNIKGTKLWVCIRSHDTGQKFHIGTSHIGVSSHRRYHTSHRYHVNAF